MLIRNETNDKSINKNIVKSSWVSVTGRKIRQKFKENIIQRFFNIHS